MQWSLSEFLNLLELRGQTWCFVELDSASGFSIPHNDAIYFYAALEGTAHIAGLAGESLKLRAGHIVMILSGEAHAIRARKQCATNGLDFLISGEYADTPPILTVGKGRRAMRLLAGRLKVRWPGGQHPRSFPSVLTLRASEGIVNFPMLLDKSHGSGAMAVFTRAATLLFVSTFRDHPQCRSAFQEFSRQDPISRALQYIQVHPFTPWTVGMLAHQVGLGRSSFATRFAQVVGRTPMKFLLEERMKHAALFLEKSDMKIAEIGKRVGYDSEAAFARRFRAYFGIAPGELRKRSRE
jgi:AraC-like DNA-binding protein